MDLTTVWVATGVFSGLGMAVAIYCIWDKRHQNEDSWLHLIDKWLQASFVSITLVGSFGLALHFSIVVPSDLEGRLEAARREAERLSAALDEARQDRDRLQTALLAAIQDRPSLDPAALEELLRSLFDDLERELAGSGPDTSDLEDELARLRRQLDELLSRGRFVTYAERVARLVDEGRDSDAQLTRDLRKLLGEVRVSDGVLYCSVPLGDDDELPLIVQGDGRTGNVTVRGP